MTVREIDVDALEALGTTDVQLIDVREPDEFDDVRVPGAQLVPLATVPDRVGDLDANTELYLICASGSRSLMAAKWLSKQGFHTTNIAGGTQGWIAAGKPFDSGAADS